MDLSKEIAGKKMKPCTFTVERGKIREFCSAIGEKNPIYLDPEAAKKEGFRDTPAPPTFQTVFQFWGYPDLFEDMRGLGIDTDRLLHTKEEYDYHEPIYPGDVIRYEPEVVDVKAGKIEMVKFKTEYINQDGKLCIEAHMSIMLRPKNM